MTKRLDNILVIEPEPPGVCALCGAIGELRPYGPGGASICYDCGMKPENKAETDRQYRARRRRGRGIRQATPRPDRIAALWPRAWPSPEW
jgi:hypothetical protein